MIEPTSDQFYESMQRIAVALDDWWASLAPLWKTITESEAFQAMATSIQQRLSADEYYTLIAQQVAAASTCHRKCGAVLVIDGMIATTAYNDTPNGMTLCGDGGCPRCLSPSKQTLDGYDRCFCVHAEERVIANCALLGIRAETGTVYTSYRPCIPCLRLLIDAGITRIVYNEDWPYQDDREGLLCDLLAASQIQFEQVGPL